MANDLAQGCPASLDLMNILFEPFHRWAAEQCNGLAVGDTFIASASFADCYVPGRGDLFGGPLSAMVWSTGGQTERTQDKCGPITAAGHAQVWQPVRLISRPIFRVVGFELGDHEPTATNAHVASLSAEAVQTSRRLASLTVPAAVSWYVAHYCPSTEFVWHVWLVSHSISKAMDGSPCSTGTARTCVP